ncbi:uncharacterized protein LOC116510285 [Thamnophis elegans]|uniref:uncharacterized protein LOC116510285 n=1 Tax=Thamnophis elegans TaxID=35005 RepID=UPI0013787B21|nr:uncharacterized protein LOC116510285 [Thamnophis elegans]
MGGTFQNQIIDDLTSLIAANEERYPNQFPYIDQWGDAVAGQADELLQCQAEMVRLCVVRPKEKGKLRSAPRRTIKIAASETKESEKKRIFAQDEEELFRPPPPYASAPVGIVVPQAMGAAAVADSGDKDSAVGIGDPQATGGVVRRKEPKEGGLGATGIRREGPVTRRLGVERAKAEKEESTLLEEKEGLFPLRVSEQQVGVDAQGDPEYRPCFQYIPFSTTDLLNWRKHFGPLSVKPTEMTDLFQTIMHSHNPNWRDIQQLLATLLTAEEREKCKAGMREVFRERYHTEADRAQKLLEEAPERDPGWDPKVAGDLAKIQTYQTLIVAALKKAGKPPVNLSKPSLVMQGADESPEAFLQRLIEAYELYTQMDPRAPENVRMLNERFIAQSALDIRKKLQRLEGALGKNTTELVEVARKVYVNRDKVEKKDKDDRMHKKTELLALALQGGRAGLGPNQCAHCGSEGHWQRECPKRLALRGRGVFRGLPGRRPLGRNMAGRGMTGRGMVTGQGGPPRPPGRGWGSQPTQGPKGRGFNAQVGAGVEGIGLAGVGWSD